MILWKVTILTCLVAYGISQDADPDDVESERHTESSSTSLPSTAEQTSKETAEATTVFSTEEQSSKETSTAETTTVFSTEEQSSKETSTAETTTVFSTEVTSETDHESLSTSSLNSVGTSEEDVKRFSTVKPKVTSETDHESPSTSSLNSVGTSSKSGREQSSSVEPTETSEIETDPDSSSTPSSSTANEADNLLTTATTAQSTDDGSKSTNHTDVDTGGDIILTTETKVTDEDFVTNSTETPTIFGDDESTTTELPTTEGIVETACSSSPCINGGNCTDNGTNSDLFECTCPSGYVGLRCEVTDKCVESEDGTLCRTGGCDFSSDGLVRFCSCFHGKLWDEEQMICRDSEPPCFPNPCQNGGTCSEEGGKVTCKCSTDYEGDNCTIHNTCGHCDNGTCVLDSSLSKKYCKCDKGLYFNEETETCEVESLPCLPNPCGNEGTCVRLSSEEFNCTCSEGFSGTTCEVTDKCTEDGDCGRGMCTLSEDETTRACQCDSGFYLEEPSHKCKETIAPCEPNPCMHGGICIKDPFTCVCPDGYTGKTCRIRDMCVMDGGNAFCANATCTNVQNLEMYYCSCPENQYFDYSQRKCLDLDLCSLTKCSSTEMCVRGKCECKQNYLLNNNTGLCEPNFCTLNPCPAPDMTCEEGSGRSDYQCRCQDGQAFNGTHCNAVSCIFPQLNSCNQVCSVTDHGYDCSCEDGFQLNEDNSTCTYNYDDTCTNKTCEIGSCVPENDIETCICPTGYVKVNGTCIDICKAGQMASGICPGDKCETVDGEGFRCKCEGKYAYSKDKITCMVRNVCEVNEVGWKTCSDKNKICLQDWSAENGFRCECPKDLIETPGEICREACSIASNQQRCSSKGATCDVDREGKIICRCPPYIKMNPIDGSCNKPADLSYLVTLPVDPEIYQVKSRQKRSLDDTVDLSKILHDASAMARELFYGFSDANIVSCKSENGYIFCKIELRFLTLEEADLKRLKINDVCVAVDNSNRCILPPSLVIVKDRFREDITIQPTDPCDEDIKEELCGSETTCVSRLQSTKHFNCSCKPGFIARRKMYPFASTRSYIEACRDIDECAEGDPCPANSDCANTIGSFLCSCKPGYRRVDDPTEARGERCVEICNPNPCTHGQCSPRGIHEFDCTCDAGYRGTFCNLQDQNFKEMRTNTVIVGVVLGGVLVITIILFIACMSRLKKKKSLEESGQMFYSSAEMTERRRVEGGAVNNAFRRD